MKFTVIFMFVFALNGCSEKRFEREEYVRRLLEEKLSADMPQNGTEYNFLVLQTISCGACTDEVLHAMNTTLSEDSVSMTLILMQPTTKQIKEKLDRLKNVTYVVDRDNMVASYGLNYPHDIYFRMRGTEIVNWMFVDDKALDKFGRIHKHAHH